ncbi:pyridoxamine 5'-phosphate oxidase family protein [Paenibacillus sp. 1011MAR3C5]|uniref:pyridoxamine 5'-phosphate oxidase family protein n=1 Tax=Paenibacillus sp. 1011MAR3C5 TaxID=1675787 RepID=UPI000E6C22A7|nr:pyridoxamine 5'-phosphate oxidase family protein [Paenibacillus sp. 1011MAR3C5]RJE90809.1 pyridoxamine 5'-phosphate oxidase family protein [Paenibacillus sp. 1011MAR3C5]
MFTVRLSQRECKDGERIEQFLQEAQTGFLGLTDGLAPYVVPLNFVWMKERGAFYFHGAEEGRKMELMARNKEACLTISESHGTIPSPIPAKTDTAYMSVMAFGEMEPVPDLTEATAAMQALLDKYVPGYYESRLAASHVERYRSSMESRTFIFKLVVRERTAKENVKD